MRNVKRVKRTSPEPVWYSEPPELRSLFNAIDAVLDKLEHGEASEGDKDDAEWCAKHLRDAFDRAKSAALPLNPNPHGNKLYLLEDTQIACRWLIIRGRLVTNKDGLEELRGTIIRYGPDPGQSFGTACDKGGHSYLTKLFPATRLVTELG
ncbi:MAG: hypothetical protein NVS1B6_00220 [Steroidobacteraceae bacterium]